MADKKEIRKIYKTIRSQLTAEEIKQLSEKICDHVLDSDLFYSAECILAYYPLGNEVDVRAVVKQAWESGKRVAFPRVKGDDMDFYEVSDFSELHEGTFGVMEPDETTAVEWQNALMLVPGVAFDYKIHRMGYGKGYYDRYLSVHPVANTLAVAYQCQIAEKIPADSHDQLLDYIVTENGMKRKMMNYEEAMAFLEDTKKYGSQLGLSSITNLMHELGDVQNEIPMVHIGGTNGKGSVGAMISSVMVASGYRVARFDTPDVFCYEEEFLDNGKPIKKERLAALFSEVASACREMVRKGLPHPTRFEVETAAAFLWFSQEKFDLALVEVGMGGETDATNIIESPLISVLTSISMDHTKFLGDRIEDIATVKSGIIKDRIQVVSMKQRREAMLVIQNACDRHGAMLHYSEAVPVLNPVCDASETGFATVWEEKPIHVSLGLHGSFQLENAACAIQVLSLLQNRYPNITADTLVQGLQTTCWPGRFERICQNPEFYLDGAHNEDAVHKLRDTLDQKYKNREIIYIMAVLADKDYREMIRTMFRPGDRVFTLTPPNPRALHGRELAELLQNQNVDALYCEKAEDAVLYALNAARERDGIVIAFGSLYNLQSVRNAFDASAFHENTEI